MAGDGEQRGRAKPEREVPGAPEESVLQEMAKCQATDQVCPLDLAMRRSQVTLSHRVAEVAGGASRTFVGECKRGRGGGWRSGCPLPGAQ